MVTALLKEAQPLAAQLAKREFTADDLAETARQLARFEKKQASQRITVVAGATDRKTLIALLARNVQRLDTVLFQTNETFKAGFAEKLDVDRLRVQRNNLVVEQQKAQRLTELSVALLKFQMGLPQQQGIRLTDSLGAAVVAGSRVVRAARVTAAAVRRDRVKGLTSTSSPGERGGGIQPLSH